MPLEPAAAALPFMKKIVKFEEDRDEHGWIFNLTCGHEVYSPLGPGVFTDRGVFCSECLRVSNVGKKP